MTVIQSFDLLLIFRYYKIIKTIFCLSIKESISKEIVVYIQYLPSQLKMNQLSVRIMQDKTNAITSCIDVDSQLASLNTNCKMHKLYVILLLNVLFITDSKYREMLLLNG